MAAFDSHYKKRVYRITVSQYRITVSQIVSQTIGPTDRPSDGPSSVSYSLRLPTDRPTDGECFCLRLTNRVNTFLSFRAGMTEKPAEEANE